MQPAQHPGTPCLRWSHPSLQAATLACVVLRHGRLLPNGCGGQHAVRDMQFMHGCYPSMTQTYQSCTCFTAPGVQRRCWLKDHPSGNLLVLDHWSWRTTKTVRRARAAPTSEPSAGLSECLRLLSCQSRWMKMCWRPTHACKMLISLCSICEPCMPSGLSGLHCYFSPCQSMFVCVLDLQSLAASMWQKKVHALVC